MAMTVCFEEDCFVTITYTNTKDFDGIKYQTGAPPVFKIMIPGQFWKASNPTEQEDMELSGGQIVTLRQSIQQKKLLEVGYMPEYMHLKLRKILMHDTVTIDGLQYRTRDPYETDEPAKRFPLRKARIWLTLYNSVERNTI